ncbi:putative ribonuclease H-like domain-containing protein [Tanacetum coccineum]
MLDQTFDRLQKLVSQLELLGKKLSQEDVNKKLLRSLSPKWNTHAVVWRNKADLNIMRMDDLYNNLTGVCEQEVKDIGSAKSKVECLQLPKRETCWLVVSAKSRNQDNKNKESSRRSVPVETSTSTALVSCDGLVIYGCGSGRGRVIMHSLLSYLQVLAKKSELMVLAYKTGLKSVEKKLEVYKANESIYSQDIKGLKLEIHIGEITIRELRKKLETVQKEKDGIQLNVDKFEHVSKSLNKLIECQIVDNYKKGLGYENYNAAPPPYIGNFMPPTPDLSFTGLVEFVNEPVVENCKDMSSKEEPKIVRKNDDALIIKEWVSDDEEEDMSQRKIEKKTVRPSIVKKELLVNTARQVNAAHSKTIVNAARLMSYLSKTAHSTIKRPIHKNTTFKNSNINQKVNTVRGKKINTTRPKAAVNAVKGNNFNVVKASGNSQIDLQDQGVIDSGCSRHMSYLTDYEEIDGGYVAFGRNHKRGKIIRKCTIKTELNNMYSVDLKNIVPKGGLTCLFAKATSDESKLWHRRLGHLNFKTMNKLVKGNLVRGLPSKLFENDQTCVACQKGKQHRASCKSKTENSISLPLHLLHMDLFGPTFVKSLKKKMYCLVVTDDYSRFTWVFFLATKDETSGILKSFITGIENLVDHKVKVIRCDNGTEFKNREMNQFCEMKGILRQFSVARTPQQNGVAERRNKTLIEAARTMLADSKTPTLSFMRPFGCPVTILNTIDHLGKFNGKADEGFFVGYSLNSMTIIGLFDIDALTRTMNYEPIVAGTQSNGFAGTKASDNAGQARKETEPVKDYILLPLWTADPPYSQDPKSSHDDGSKPSSDDGKKVDEDPRKDSECKDQEKEDNVNSTNNVNTASNVNTVSSTVNAAGTNEVNAVGGKTSIELPFDLNMPALEDDSIFDFSRDDEDDGAVADMNNLETTIQSS